MQLRYHINPETELPHIYDHGVTEPEVEQILRNAAGATRGEGHSRIVVGQTFAGRYLKVVYVPDADADGVFVVTAYPITGKALASYRRRRRKK